MDEKQKEKRKHFCSHPLLHPTMWDQPRPEPVEMVGCCDSNQTCPVCGFGWGSYPCECMRKRQEKGE